MATMFPLAPEPLPGQATVFDVGRLPGDPTPMERGEFRSSGPAPWQLPSGGATTPDAAFQFDFEQAKQFHDAAIASGDRTPQEADAIYFAPLRAKWKTISSTPKLLEDPNEFLKFNMDFSKAADSFAGQVNQGQSPKVAAAATLAPTLESWTLRPSMNLTKQRKPEGDPELMEAVKLALAGAPREEVIGALGSNVTTSKLNYLQRVLDDVGQDSAPKRQRAASTINQEIKDWQRRLYNPNISPQQKEIVSIAIKRLEEELESPYTNQVQGVISGDERQMDESAMYRPKAGAFDESQILPLPVMENVPQDVPHGTSDVPQLLGDRKSTLDIPGAPKPNTVVKGYRFIGGNPADKSNWEKVK